MPKHRAQRSDDASSTAVSDDRVEGRYVDRRRGSRRPRQARSTIQLGPTQWVVLKLIVALARRPRPYMKNMVSREELVRELRQVLSPQLGASAIEPMVTRMLRRFWELGLVDLEHSHG